MSDKQRGKIVSLNLLATLLLMQRCRCPTTTILFNLILLRITKESDSNYYKNGPFERHVVP